MFLRKITAKICGVGLLLAFAAELSSQTEAKFAGSTSSASCLAASSKNSFLGVSTIRLWPGDAPGAKGVGCEDIPTLSVLTPGRANGSAVIVMPGGAYLGFASVLEGREVADWFTARGFTAFVLRYRLGKNYVLPVPLIDARRAVQLVRTRANDYHIAPDRIAVIGFSAGGHLAALSGTQPANGNPEADDVVERVSSRPDVLILGYPWIGAMSPDRTRKRYYCQLMDAPSQCEQLQKDYSPEMFVTKDTPPTFIYHTTEDEQVPVEQAISFYEALLKAGVSGEMHIFAHGSHGSGLGSGNATLDQWPNLLENWLRDRGLLTVDAVAIGSK
jgi:acetyl esterase/lipase